MADITATVVGFEVTTIKWDSGLKQEVPGRPTVYVKVQLPDGRIQRIFQGVSQEAIAGGWPEKVLGSQGLQNILRLLPIIGKQVAVWEKASDNPQYPRPSWQFAQNPVGSVPAPPVQQAATPLPPAAYVAANPPAAAPQQDEIPFDKF